MTGYEAMPKEVILGVKIIMELGLIYGVYLMISWMRTHARRSQGHDIHLQKAHLCAFLCFCFVIAAIFYPFYYIF